MILLESITPMKDDGVVYCNECGRKIQPNDDVYECRTHSTLCEDCLKMLHKKYVVRW